jgi:glycosyltransferase involved in cell wall biosynthesis
VRYRRGVAVTSTGGPDSPPGDLSWLGCDCVVVFASSGWKQELRSNRYHWMRRWARHLPVVMVQPDLAPRKAAWSEPAPGIEECELLHVQRWGHHPSTAIAFAQARAIARRLDERGLVRPLAWTYAPMLALPAALVPAVARVHHATENYYRFPGLNDEFYWSLALCARSADLVVSVSSGVTSSLREHLPELGDALVEITNGCDFAQALAAPDPDPEAAALAARWERMLVYAGNLNGRLDFELIVRIARAEPRSLVLLVGPVRGLNATERGRWSQLLEEPNVHHEEAMSADRLPAVYRAADVGIVPYLPLRELVDDGFPLKVLEMAATGLPMVSTMMRPIVDLHSGIRVVADREEFLAALPATGRNRLGAELSASLVELASAHDYDKKFGELVGHLRGRRLPDHPSTRYDVASRIDPQRTSAPLLVPDDFDSYPLATRVALRAAARTHDAIAPRLPPSARKRIKSLAKRALRT